MSIFRMLMVFVFIASMQATTGLAVDEADDKKLRDERRQLRFELSRTRVQLLREVAELRELHEQIVRMQRQLTRKLDKQSAMIELRKKLAAVGEKTLN